MLSLLLLADGRFPAGGHAHSAGMESAVADGRVRDLEGLEAFARGRLHTAGLVDAALAVATMLTVEAATDDVAVRAALRQLDEETSARVTASPLRSASRRMGRQIARAASRCWPCAALALLAEECPDGAHLPVAQGVVALAAGLSHDEVALLVLHHTLTTPVQAAVRLLGLDPFGVAALTARLGGLAEDIAARAVALASAVIADGSLDELPALGTPVIDIAAIEHQAWDMRLFAS